MTTGKPPHPPQKTLLGLPSDMQDALKKLQAQKQQKEQQALQQRTHVKPPTATPQPPAAQGNLDQTLYGNPHDAGAPQAEARAPRPVLPREQAFQVPQRAPASTQPSPRPSGQGIAGKQRTMLGMPSDVAAAIRQVQVRSAAAPSNAAPQSTRAAASPATSWPPVSESKSPWATPDARPQTSASVQPTAAVAQATGARPAPVAQATGARPAPVAQATGARPAPVAQATQASQAALAQPAAALQPTASRSGVQRTGASASVPPPLTPRASTNANAADHESQAPNPTATAAPSRPATVSRSMTPPPNTPAPAPANGMLATRLVTFEPGALVAQPPSEMRSQELSVPALNITDQAGPRRAAPVRRWPALSLIGLAIVAFGGVVLVRAPGVLPAPLAALVTPRRPAPPREQPSPASAPQPTAANEQAPPGEAAADAPPTAAAATAQPTAAGSVPAQPTADTAVAAQPTAAAVQAIQGSSAQLEKQAIDLLIANDYAAARAVYERLKLAEPTRPEYSVMLDLLARELAPNCGGPGQVPCSAP